ncbi:hypothetical protein C3L33_09852, partial [Rhododendron williamsianum]
MDEDFESFARFLRPCELVNLRIFELVGFDSLERYLPHRVAMQFGMDQDLPSLVPRFNDIPELKLAQKDAVKGANGEKSITMSLRNQPEEPKGKNVENDALGTPIKRKRVNAAKSGGKDEKSNTKVRKNRSRFQKERIAGKRMSGNGKRFLCPQPQIPSSLTADYVADSERIPSDGMSIANNGGNISTQSTTDISGLEVRTSKLERVFAQLKVERLGVKVSLTADNVAGKKMEYQGSGLRAQVSDFSADTNDLASLRLSPVSTNSSIKQKHDAKSPEIPSGIKQQIPSHSIDYDDRVITVIKENNYNYSVEGVLARIHTSSINIAGSLNDGFPIADVGHVDGRLSFFHQKNSKQVATWNPETEKKGKSLMEGRYGGSSGWTSWRNEEFQEEDVWAVCSQSKDFYSKPVVSSESSPSITPRRLPSAAKMIPRSTNSSSTQEPKVVQQSAPVKIPDWSKIYGKNSKKDSWHDDDGGGGGDGGGDGDDGNMMMPPHEWVARKHGRSQATSFSVCEGAGRTLKGRDLSRVRNAVLSRTGFLD